MKPFIESTERIFTISFTFIHYSFRQISTHIILLFFIILILLTPEFALFTFGENIRLILETTYSTILIGGVIQSVLSCSSSIQEEVENKVLLTLISKPLNRFEFIVGKYIGGLAISLYTIVILGIVFVIMVDFREISNQYGENIILSADLAYGFLLIFMQIAILLSISFLAIPYFKTPVSICFSLGMLFLCNANGFLLEALTKSDSSLNYLFVIIFYLIPDFTIYNLGEIIARNTTVDGLLHYIIFASLYTALYTTVILSISNLMFRRKEIV
ncbi:MAG: hypothetical protein COA79_16815 [Planctomycetota bacterium]|nr:MAG: hypothetical protein COA79_16815 [Planctomycetota bacterium]